MVRYLSQARELERLAGESKIIRIETCDSTETGDLLRILGYRMRGGCGSDVVLETVNAIARLPHHRFRISARRAGTGAPHQPALHARLSSRPRPDPLYGRLLAVGEGQKHGRVHRLLSFAILPCAACIWAFKLDPETADELREEIPAPRLKIYAHVLDFFGGMFQIRDGKAVVPGGARIGESVGAIWPARRPIKARRSSNS